MVMNDVIEVKGRVKDGVLVLEEDKVEDDTIVIGAASCCESSNLTVGFLTIESTDRNTLISSLNDKDDYLYHPTPITSSNDLKTTKE